MNKEQQSMPKSEYEETKLFLGTSPSNSTPPPIPKPPLLKVKGTENSHQLSPGCLLHCAKWYADVSISDTCFYKLYPGEFAVRRSADGNFYTGDAQIARQVLEADTKNVALEVSAFSDVTEDPAFVCPNDLPLNNRNDLAQMKDIDTCKNPGSVLYMEFDVKDYPVEGYKKLREVNEEFTENAYVFRINATVHKQKLFNRDIIYILNGMKGFRTINNHLMNYRDSLHRPIRPKKFSQKATHYIQIHGTALVFGFQIRIDPKKLDTNEYLTPSRVFLAKPQIEKYFFQFYVPDSIFTNPREYPRPDDYYIEDQGMRGMDYSTGYYSSNNIIPPNYYQPSTNFKAKSETNLAEMTAHLSTLKLSDSSTIRMGVPLKKTPFYPKRGNEFRPKIGFTPSQPSAGSTNIIIGHVDNMVVNNNFQYSLPPYPHMYAPQYPYSSYQYMPYAPQYPSTAYPEHTYDAKQRLSNLTATGTLPALDTNETLLFTFLKHITPENHNIAECCISKLWESYKESSEKGIELFRGGLGERPKMAVYTPSLSGLYLVADGKVVVEYFETVPYHMRIPLFNKVQELSETYSGLGSLKISEVDPKSWFGVLWTPTHCTAQLRITGQFLVYYRLSSCCEQAGMLCYKLKECEFWKSVLGHKASIELIKAAQEQITDFVAKEPQGLTFDYNSIMNYIRL